MTVQSNKSYAMSRFQVKVDGHPLTSFIKSVEGGLLKTESATNLTGPFHIPVRNITTRTVEPITMEIGLSGTDWLMGLLADVINKRVHTRLAGEILHADVNTEVRFHQEFSRALVTEIVLPALDANGKDSAFVKLKLQPEVVTFGVGNGAKLLAEKETKQKIWNAANFRLNLELGSKKIRCEHVTKIEAITVKIGTKAHQRGGFFLPEYVPTKLEVGKLGVTLPLHFATDFIEWYKNAVTTEGVGMADPTVGIDRKPKKGNHYEASGSIEYLDPSCTKVLYEIKLMGVTPENFTITKTEGASNNYKSCKFDMYCTQIEVSRGGFAR